MCSAVSELSVSHYLNNARHEATLVVDDEDSELVAIARRQLLRVDALEQTRSALLARLEQLDEARHG